MRPYITEEEARTRQCPLRAAAVIPFVIQAKMNGAPNEGLHKYIPPIMSCDASDCMWWGWMNQSTHDIKNDGRRGRCAHSGA